jgi:hypothetical protein
MDNKTGIIAGTFLFLMILALALVLNGFTVQADTADIEKWAAKEGYSVVSVEKPWFDHPFWLADEDDRIYKVIVRSKDTERVRIAYLRFRSLFGPEVRWKE